MKINKPYIDALRIASFRVVDFFMKKETVSGIIGNTHGVIKANNPAKTPKKKIPHNPLFFVAGIDPQSRTGFFKSIEGIWILAGPFD